MTHKWVLGVIVLVLVQVAGIASADLVAHWQFNEGTGTTAFDSTANANDGTLIDMEESDWGLVPPLGGTLEFDRSNDYILVPDDATMDFGSGPFSIALWIKIDSGDGGQVIHNGTSVNNADLGGGQLATGKRYIVSVTGGRVAFDIDDGSVKAASGANSATYIADTGWRHVVCSRVINETENMLHIYIDGVSVATANAASVGNIDSPNEPLLIGRRYIDETPNFFGGEVADIRLYNHALTEQEMIDLIPDFPIAWYPDPANGQQNVGLTSDLSWSPPGDADGTWSYKVYLDTDEDPSDAVPYDVVPDANGLNLYNSVFGGLSAGDYSWRVDSINPVGPETRTGDVWTFNAGVALPILVSPPNNIGIGYGLEINEPNLVWTSDTNPLRDASEILLTPLGGTQVSLGEQTSPFDLYQFSLANPSIITLEWGQTYTWQILELDAADNIVAVGDEWQFRIRTLGCINMVADIDGSNDCIVNLADLAVMAGEWLSCGWDDGGLNTLCPDGTLHVN